MISRTAFNQLRHSWLLLFATLLGLVVTYLLPPLLLFSHDPLCVTLGALAWLLMSLCYLPMVRFYGLSPAWCIVPARRSGVLCRRHGALRAAIRRGPRRTAGKDGCRIWGPSAAPEALQQPAPRPRDIRNRVEPAGPFP